MTEPVKRDNSGFELVSSDEDERIITSATYAGGKGFHLQYDQTSVPKEFKLTKEGISWSNGTQTFVTALDKLAAVETAFQAVREPPNSTTLKVDNTLLLDDGSRQGEFGSTGFSYADPSFPDDFNMNFDATTMAMYFNDTRSPNSFQVAINTEYINIEDYATTPATPVRTNIRGGQILLSELAFPNRTNTIKSNQIRMTNGGFLTELSGGVVSVSASGQGSTIMGTMAFYVNQQSGGPGTANPVLSLQNSSSDTSAGTCVYEEAYRNKPAAGVAGDQLYQHSVWGKDGAFQKQEFTRVTHTIRDPSNNAEDGSIQFQCMMNGVMDNFIQINGNDGGVGEVNIYKGLDLNGSGAGLVKVSGGGSVNMTLDASSSAGTGSIILNTKDGTAGSGNGLRMTGNTLLSASAGGNSGQHLCLTINGVVYKIALLSA